MSLALAKKSLSLIDSTSATSKTKKSKNKRKNTFKQNHQQELSADSRTEDVVQRLLAYNNTNFDENVAKKVKHDENNLLMIAAGWWHFYYLNIFL